jgi:hypothetical protein
MIDETDIRDRFVQLREVDRVSAPGFAQTCGRARARKTRGVTRRVRPLVLGAAAVIAIVAFSLAHSRSFSPSTPMPAIVTWRAPTDVLLRTPGSELLGTMPALNTSVLDKMIPTPSNRGT